MRNVNRKGTQEVFPKVSRSRHSPLVLDGAPAQGCSSPLICARIKCSLQANSLPLRQGESPTTTHMTSRVLHKLHRRITELPNTTGLSRWCRSPRGTSLNSHLTHTSLGDGWMHTCCSWLLSRRGCSQGFSNLSNTLGSCTLTHSLKVFSTIQMSKRSEMDEVKEYKYPHTSHTLKH
jgi:hypothetical protein